MPDQYSDSSEPVAAPLVLALDGGSPRVSAALGRGRRILAARDAGGGDASSTLLRLIDEILAEAGVAVAEVERFLAVRGPGSFTGLRVGLATVLGLHQATGRPATAVTTFEALVWQARGRGRVVAVADALRGEWFAQPWETGDGPPRAEAEAAIVSPRELFRWAPCRIVGFDVERLAAAADLPAAVTLVAAEPLAPALVALAGWEAIDWDSGRLSRPLYLRPVATTRPG